MYEELKKYAEIALKTHDTSSLSKSLKMTDFYSRANPSAVLALIADLESYKQGAKVEADAGDEARSEVAKLKAENEALRNVMQDVWCISPGQPGCGDISRTQRTFADVDRVWREINKDDDQ